MHTKYWVFQSVARIKETLDEIWVSDSKSKYALLRTSRSNLNQRDHMKSTRFQTKPESPKSVHPEKSSKITHIKRVEPVGWMSSLVCGSKSISKK